MTTPRQALIVGLAAGALSTAIAMHAVYSATDASPDRDWQLSAAAEIVGYVNDLTLSAGSAGECEELADALAVYFVDRFSCKKM